MFGLRVIKVIVCLSFYVTHLIDKIILMYDFNNEIDKKKAKHNQNQTNGLHKCFLIPFNDP